MFCGLTMGEQPVGCSTTNPLFWDVAVSGDLLSCVPFSCFPTSALFQFDASQFRVLMFRSLWLPFPPSSRNCGVGVSSTSLAAVLGRRGSESAVPRICREAGARVGTNVMVCDMDLLSRSHLDTRQVGGVGVKSEGVVGRDSSVPATVGKKFKARTEALPQQARARAAWLLRWRTHPTHAEVVSEHRHVSVVGGGVLTIVFSWDCD